MNVHEYQAKNILDSFGLPILKGAVAYTAEEAEQAAAEIANELWVVKAQIHAGGRGKAGGVILARSVAEVKAAAEKLLNKVLVTHQTGPEGQNINRIFIEEGCNIKREFYISLVLNRAERRLCIVASTEGGVDIEEVAKNTPKKIIKEGIDPVLGVMPYQGRKLAFALGLPTKTHNAFCSILKGLYDAANELDTDMIEINPFVLTADDELVALDAKVSFDDNALYRHPEIEALRDEAEEDPAELEAKKHDLNYVKLDGTIGCMVNGAGLAMATMDIVKLHGASPANFLDVGGGATKEKVEAAFKIILSDKNVKAVLINIFGGIMRCDIIAEGIIAAAKEIKLNVPMVVRLQGTNHELGKKILAESGLAVITADDLDDAAHKVVEASSKAAA
ncbi:MAG: ADP-forming succinate--CoA ligase subunit beta [Candidatus Paracaedibacteraceae bacterium]|nr:ADP-forming succinate--CoA ligase subunit beta [Candidatus Paracaedibacteraceae bacterium]